MTTEQVTDGAQTNTDATSETTTAAAATLLSDPPAGEQQQVTDDATKVELTDEEKAAAETARLAAEAEAEANKVPDEYADFTAPDGVALDAEVATEFKALAKELALPQAKAQKVADLGTKMMGKWQAQQAEQMSEASAKWATDTKADKEIGGDKLPENLAVARKALDTFGSPELKTLLNESGLGNHPEIIRLLHKAGKAISEDTYVNGQAGKQSARDPKSMYPNSNHN